MILLIVGALLALVALGVLVFGGDFRWVGGVLLVVGAVFVVLSCLTSVPAQNVGVVTAFGKPLADPLGPGVHWKAPWHKVNDMDGTIQQVNNNDGEKGKTQVRLNSNTMMFVDNNLRWKIKQAEADKLFLNWKKFDNIGPGLVERELAAGLNVTLADYDPLKPGDKDALAELVKDRLETRVGTQIEIVSFTITRIDFDEETQKRINGYQEEVAKTRIEEQRKATVDAQVENNNKLSKSLATQGEALNVNKCLDIVREGKAPAGFQCFGGGNGGVVLTKEVK
jgi:regulator of protease activity HflC (stomatin/prohibitin superfamily)